MWLPVRFANRLCLNMSKHLDCCSHSQYPLKPGLLSAWTSSKVYQILITRQWLWWWLINLRSMLTSYHYPTHSLPFKWPKCFWIKFTSFMAFQRQSFQTGTECSQARYGKNCFVYQIQSFSWVLHTTPKPIVSQSVWTNAWRPFCIAWWMHALGSGLTGSRLLNTGITQHSTQHLGRHRLKFCMGNHPDIWASLTLLFVKHKTWKDGCRKGTCWTGWFISSC